MTSGRWCKKCNFSLCDFDDRYVCPLRSADDSCRLQTPLQEQPELGTDVPACACPEPPPQGRASGSVQHISVVGTRRHPRILLVAMLYMTLVRDLPCV